MKLENELMTMSLPEQVRKDFPILSTKMNNIPLAYLDNGATTQKPQCVIDAIVDFYANDNSNIHRGVYELSLRATDRYEKSRKIVADFIRAQDPHECIFVRGATEAINLVRCAWGEPNLRAGDEIILTSLEHHSNIVPWQLLCERTGAKLVVVRPNERGEIEAERFTEALSDHTKLVALQHVSNALGSVHDVRLFTELAKDRSGAIVLVDGAQWIAHGKTDVQAIGCDFYVFSGHKLYGPTGIGVLWGKRSLLERMSPYQGGGDMIETVSFDGTTYADIPNKFEAGTPDIAGAIGLGAAIRYVESIGFERIVEHEQALLREATRRLGGIAGLRIVGEAKRKEAVISFVIEEPPIAPIDIASALASDGIAVRTGHHCCMPLMKELGVPGTTRASFAMYNTFEEVERLASSLEKLIQTRREALGPVAASTPRTNSLETAIAFLPPTAASPNDAAALLKEEFLMFDDAESKTELLMELGQGLPHSFGDLKAISEPVPGCMSEVYLIGRPTSEDDKRLEFAADSNALIVRGLIALLLNLFSGQAKHDIVQFDVEKFFREIGLDQFVSTQRRSGLNGMLTRIKNLSSL